MCVFKGLSSTLAGEHTALLPKAECAHETQSSFIEVHQFTKITSKKMAFLQSLGPRMNSLSSCLLLLAFTYFSDI